MLKMSSTIHYIHAATVFEQACNGLVQGQPESGKIALPLVLYGVLHEPMLVYNL